MPNLAFSYFSVIHRPSHPLFRISKAVIIIGTYANPNLRYKDRDVCISKAPVLCAKYSNVLRLHLVEINLYQTVES